MQHIFSKLLFTVKIENPFDSLDNLMGQMWKLWHLFSVLLNIQMLTSNKTCYKIKTVTFYKLNQNCTNGRRPSFEFTLVPSSSWLPWPSINSGEFFYSWICLALQVLDTWVKFILESTMVNIKLYHHHVCWEG